MDVNQELKLFGKLKKKNWGVRGWVPGGGGGGGGQVGKSGWM